MNRERATSLLAEMIDRLEQGAWPLGLVTEVWIFGSYAGGALEPGDVDVAVEHGTDEKWLGESVYASSYGKDAYASMKQALRGRRRGLSVQFRGRDTLREEGFELTLLWQRGEPFDLARRRLDSITADPTAGRAPRDHMLPAFEGIEHLVPRPARIELHRLHTAGAITVRAFALPDAEPADPSAAQHLSHRWVETSPLRRAASAALAYLEEQGTDLAAVELNRKRLHRDAGDPVCLVDLGWHYFRVMTRLLQHGQAWLEVPRASAGTPLHALHAVPTAPPPASSPPS